MQFPKYGKVSSHSKGKIWENTNIAKQCVSQIFWEKQKSIQFPKYEKSEFTLYGKSKRKHRDFP